MKYFFFALGTCLVFTSIAQPAKKIKISNNDFKVAEGTWDGKLISTGSDDKTQITMPSILTIRCTDELIHLKFVSTAADGIKFTDSSTISINDEASEMLADGQDLDILGVRKNAGSLVIIAGTDLGTDQNKAAELKYTYTISPNAVIILKQVGYPNGKNYFMRSRYMALKKL